MAKIKKWYDHPLLGHILVFLTVIAALSSTLIATEQLKQSQRVSSEEQVLQKEIKAYETWERFSEISLKNPDVSGLSNKIVSNKFNDNTKYRWYMERLLIAAEQIMLSAKGDRQWELAILFEISPRYKWFLSEEFIGNTNSDTSMKDSSFCTYISDLRRVISEGVVEGYRSDVASHKAIAQQSGISSLEALKQRLDRVDGYCVYPDKPTEAAD